MTRRSPIQVAVVEDDPFVITILEAALLPHFDVKLYESGARALRHIQAQPPDVVLLDISLPDLDGDAILRALRGNPRTKDLPTVAVTGHDTLEDRQRLLKQGFDAWIPKTGLDPALLIGVINDFGKRPK